jgi:hypothetical protein
MKLKSKFSTSVEKKRLELIANEYERTHQHPSVLVYTTHKCASMFISKLTDEVAKQAFFQHIDYAKTIYEVKDLIGEHEKYKFLEENSNLLFRTHGEIYSPIRKPIHSEHLRTFKKIFILRDPRDVIVSSYYSFGFTHHIPMSNARTRDKFINERKRIQAEGIDAYARRISDSWLPELYGRYKELQIRSKHNLFLSYDLLMEEQLEFITQFARFCIPDIKDENINFIYNQVGKKSISQKSAHRRSGKSRQFEDELSFETREYVNKNLEKQLEQWKFTI